eukprot:3962851-Pyramimonas_sp.AAC.1
MALKTSLPGPCARPPLSPSNPRACDWGSWSESSAGPRPSFRRPRARLRHLALGGAAFSASP